MELKHLTNKNFEEKVLEAKTAVLVDFFATWCGPCQMLTPVLESVQEEMGEKVEVFKIDVDEEMNIARRFGVMSVPTMIIFKDGKELQRIVGLRQKNQIIQMLESV
ncbi:MAG: thioredoxin [Clostridia bacterium]|nr:thioredoxin [Clostridia bacterium]